MFWWCLLTRLTRAATLLINKAVGAKIKTVDEELVVVCY